MSVEQWLQLERDIPGELVDGRLVEEEVVSTAHECVVAWLLFEVRRWVRQRGGFVFASQYKVPIGGDRGRKPDLSAWVPLWALPGARSRLGRVPNLAIEVLTPTPRDIRRDRVEKRADYTAARIKQYWLVDPVARTIEILERRRDGRYVQALVASTGRHEVPRCPGFSLDLDALWAEVDEANEAIGEE